jgi:hypothetical protein
MRKALIVGIDHYEHVDPLFGCVNDAHAVKAILDRHANGTLNFGSRLLVGTGAGPQPGVSRSDLKKAIRELFADDSEIALLYFAGHGYVEDTGGFLCGSDSSDGDDGLPLKDVMVIADLSPATNKVIILDSCHSGSAGSNPTVGQGDVISDGMTILAASTTSQSANEVRGPSGTRGGVFTNLLVDALNGAAANLLGDITPGSVYAHIDQSLGAWMQRPVFKTNVKSFVSLRRAEAPIDGNDLRAMTTVFPAPDHQLHLDPSFEPERSPEQAADASIPLPDPANNATFRILQDYARVNLVRPVDAPHMWHAAMESKACELTALGQHYWNLVAQDLL